MRPEARPSASASWSRWRFPAGSVSPPLPASSRSDKDMTTESNQREDVACAYRILAHHNVIDAYGHVSVRSEKNPNRYIMARHLAPELVRPEDLIEYDLDSNPMDANGRESVRERFIH